MMHVGACDRCPAKLVGAAPSELLIGVREQPTWSR
jgi:hypothetical protein